MVQSTSLDLFVLFGLSKGCAYSIRYAAKNPDRVAGLVPCAGFLRDPLRRGLKERADLHETTQTIIRQGWGSPNPAYRHRLPKGRCQTPAHNKKGFYVYKTKTCDLARKRRPDQ